MHWDSKADWCWSGTRPTLPQMLQSHLFARSKGSTWRVYVTAPQWQLPSYITNPSLASGRVGGCGASYFGGRAAPSKGSILSDVRSKSSSMLALISTFSGSASHVIEDPQVGQNFKRGDQSSAHKDRLGLHLIFTFIAVAAWQDLHNGGRSFRRSGTASVYLHHASRGSLRVGPQASDSRSIRKLAVWVSVYIALGHYKEEASPTL